MAFATLKDVFTEQIEDLYSAEEQLVQALPRMADAVSDADLFEAIERHLDQTRGHIERLDLIKQELGIIGSERSKGMAGLLAESDAVINEPGSGPPKDAAIIAAAQRVEHYEIAGYGTARSLAGELGYKTAKKLLDETLKEESSADALFSRIATGGFLGSGLNTEAKAPSA